VIGARERLGPGLHWRLIIPVVSGTLLAIAAGQIACAVVAIASDGGAMAFVWPVAVTVPLALVGIVHHQRLRSIPLRARDGFAAVTLAWVAASVVGAVPFLIAGTFDRPVDAIFESVSGLTTCGATLIDEMETQPDAVLFWRSMSHWIGGVGIVVLVVAIAPATGHAFQRVFYAETSGVTAERLTPRLAETAKIIAGVYLALTAAGFLAFWIAGMSPWDALNHIFATVATGGFSTHTASIAFFDSVAIELVAIVFMWAGGVNFAFYWLVLKRRDRLWPQAAEVRAYLVITLIATAAVAATLVLAEDVPDVAEALRHSAFAVVSLMTTTGFVTVDFDEWNDVARMTLIAIMFVGACAGSTAGGLKVIRVMLLGRSAAQELQRQVRPKAVQILRAGGRVYPEDIRRGVYGFVFIYLIVFAIGTLFVVATGMDIVSAASGVAATLNVTGPGLSRLGALENYGAVSQAGLWAMSALMLIGRLEIFTVLVLLTPAFWRPTIA
jgi:trk system potassium uptake protein TrkH